MNSQDKINLLFEESEKVSLQDIFKSLNEIIILQGFLLQTAYELKPVLNEGEVYIETLITKLIFASQSILRLSTPQELMVYNSDKKIEIIDTPSIFILTRSIIETFLTLEYLYFDNVSDSEKDFRFKLWRVSGYMSRQVFTDEVSDIHKVKLEQEQELINEIKSTIKDNPLYTTLKSNDLWKLDKFGLPRLKSWGNLIKVSRLKSDLFKKMYNLYSNYAHSEYISMIQINEGNLSKDNLYNISLAEMALLLIQMINSITILLLKEKFEGLEEYYCDISDEMKVRIELWSGIALK